MVVLYTEPCPNPYIISISSISSGSRVGNYNNNGGSGGGGGNMIVVVLVLVLIVVLIVVVVVYYDGFVYGTMAKPLSITAIMML